MTDLIFDEPIFINCFAGEFQQLTVVAPCGDMAEINLNWLSKKQIDTLISVLKDVSSNMENK